MRPSTITPFALRVLALLLLLPACEPIGTLEGGDATSCNETLDALVACLQKNPEKEASCQPVAHGLEQCTSSGRGPMSGGIVEDLMQRLQEHASACYAQRDADCLKRVYTVLAIGGLLKGLPVAARNMDNFLYLGTSPLRISAEPLRADLAVQERLNADRALARLTAQDFLRAGGGDECIPLATGVVAGQSQDIWYGLGSFTLATVAEVRRVSSTSAEVTLVVTVTDRYDWHPGLTADGPVEGMGLFEDAWAQLLVDTGRAHEFDMTSTWSETFTVFGAAKLPNWAACTLASDCASNRCGCNGGSVARCLPSSAYSLTCH